MIEVLQLSGNDIFLANGSIQRSHFWRLGLQRVIGGITTVSESYAAFRPQGSGSFDA